MNTAAQNMIYLDWAASAPPEPSALDEARDVSTRYFANPSAPHAAGRLAEEKLAEARARFAGLLGVDAREIVFRLVDIVSKGGNYLLNVGPTSEGLIPQPSVDRLMEVGSWMETNGEAIYGTSPWKVFHESSGDPETEKADKKRARITGGIRFTAKGDSVYAVCLSWPEQDVRVRALGSSGVPGRTIAAVSMLGSKEGIQWRQADDGLALSVPREKPCRYAFVYRIDFKKD
jgi:alpha-L-fucosidase